MSNIVMFKSQLQEYAQKASLPLPVYETTKEGLSHEPKFRSSVTVNGVRYDSPSEFRNLKAAEHAAAQVALEDLLKKTNGAGPVPNRVHDTGLCKNLLQEYAQKMSLPLPIYRSTKSGEIHSPTFTSTVDVSGVSYTGGVASNKKEAEIKAARTALLAIQEQACNYGSQAIVSNILSAQLEVFSGRKRERDLEEPSEVQKVVTSKQKPKAHNSTLKDEVLVENDSKPVENNQERLSAEDASPSSVKETQKQLQQDSCVIQQGQVTVEGGVAHEEKEPRLEELQDQQQVASEVAPLETLNKRHKKEGKSPGETQQKKRKNRRNKGIQQEAQQQTFPATDTAHISNMTVPVGSS